MKAIDNFILEKLHINKDSKYRKNIGELMHTIIDYIFTDTKNTDFDKEINEWVKNHEADTIIKVAVQNEKSKSVVKNLLGDINYTIEDLKDIIEYINSAKIPFWGNLKSSSFGGPSGKDYAIDFEYNDDLIKISAYTKPGNIDFTVFFIDGSK